MRTTGAQRLARAGVTEAQIRLFGRWAPRAMLEYVRDALLAEDGVAVARQVEERAKEPAGGKQLGGISVGGRKRNRCMPSGRCAEKPIDRRGG